MTYRPCDGVEAGEYTLSFKHVPTTEARNGKGEDLLKGRYADPERIRVQTHSGTGKTAEGC